MKYNELKRVLLRYGCQLIRESANHEWWFSPLTGKCFPVSRHGVEEIPKGTLKCICIQAGVSI
ncbi:MAG: type II toxin-antitoxin system HicA family toxin [Bacteroidales bacterium]|nr:type II toxin-antitoxin system HicA family toxin [Bacteroidales bacterium]